MKTAVNLAILAVPLINAAGKTGDPVAPMSSAPSAGHRSTVHDLEKRKMKITIGSKTFQATLEDNPAAKELKGLLPLSLEMAELNGNEKHVDLPKALPTDAQLPGTIREGDLLLYGDRTLVLFYKTFKSSYRYTRLGRIDDPAGLAAALGKGSVEVAFLTK